MTPSFSALLTTALLLAANLETAHAVFCTFYSDSACISKVGSVSYSTSNTNCFTNPGTYIKCDARGIQVSLDVYPPDSCGTTPDSIFGFPSEMCSYIGAIAAEPHQYKLVSTGHEKRRRYDAKSSLPAAQPIVRAELPDEVEAEKPNDEVPTNSTLVDRDTVSCQAQVEFYYGGECLGPAANYQQEVTEGISTGQPWVSACQNNGLYGRYILQQSRCDLIVWEGENCSGTRHDVFTTPNTCHVLVNDQTTMRSWQWSCAPNACNES